VGHRARPHAKGELAALERHDLVLDAGAPVLMVQVLLGHKHADTTLGYARLHDGAVVAGFCRPIGEIVSRV